MKPRSAAATVIREFFSAIGSKGGGANSPLQLAARRANLIKAWEARRSVKSTGLANRQ